MKLAIISFTKAGGMLCRRLANALREAGELCDGYVQERYLRDGHAQEENAPDGSFGGGQGKGGTDLYIHPVKVSVTLWTQEQFANADGLIYIGAAGIAVRAVAPYVKDKMTDPAVLVVDDRGRYVISLLSGHLGGANGLARLVAGMIGAEPVITTASDVNGKTAIDVWAAGHGMKVGSREMAKQVAAAFLDDEPVGFFCDEPVDAAVPEGCIRNTKCRLNVRVTARPNTGPGGDELHLIPQMLQAGIGCRRGTKREKIEQALVGVLDRYGLYRDAVAGIASIDLKKEEAGLKELASLWGLPFRTYPAKELEQVSGVSSESCFVRQVAGVGNVCERAALLAAGPEAELIVPKQALDGVTVAIARRPGLGRPMHRQGQTR